jgi:hypothetical protein
MNDALFAVCAFVDEAFLSVTWAGRDEWAASSLQWENFQENNAGELFYTRLYHLLALLPSSLPEAKPENAPLAKKGGSDTRLDINGGKRLGKKLLPAVPPVWKPLSSWLGQRHKAQPAGSALPAALVMNSQAAPPGGEDYLSRLHNQVLALYATCLSLGFSGRYYQDRQALRQITGQCLQAYLAEKADSPDSLITPEAYYMPENPARYQPYSRARFILAVLIPLAVSGAIYLGYHFFLQAHFYRYAQFLGQG